MSAGDWQVPDDLYAAPIVVHMDEYGDRVVVDLFDDGTGQHFLRTDTDDPVVTADDLRTIAARLVAIADTIQPPTHDPDAEEWCWVDLLGGTGGLHNRATAERQAQRWNDEDPMCAPHRVVHMSELGR